MNITVRTSPLSFTKGILRIGDVNLRCALGRSGMLSIKREGDGGTPIGAWSFRQVFFRSDKVACPVTTLPVRSIQNDDGWCDAPGDANYNRFVKRPYSASSETLWRDDVLYDIIVVLGHNESPRVQGGGSAIFMHVAKPGYPPTEGCVALYEQDLRRVLKYVNEDSRLVIL